MDIQSKIDTFNNVWKSQVTCNFCDITIWKAPIFRKDDNNGVKVACENCKRPDFYKVGISLSDAILRYEIPCKYNTDGCDVGKDPVNILIHEEECQFRYISFVKFTRLCIDNPFHSILMTSYVRNIG